MAHKPEVAQVPLNLLIIDPAVQRPLDKKKADKIAAELNLDAIGLICVSRRDSGAYSVIDGQHRAEALRTAGFVTDSVECEIFHGLTLADEAAMFRLRNNRTAVQKVDLFRVRVIEGDAVAVAINDMLARHGWQVGLSSKDGWIGAIEALESVWLADPNGNPPAAERAIVSISAAWGHGAAGVDRSIVAGLGALYVRYGADANSGDIVERLAKMPGGPKHLIGRARGLRDFIGGRMSSAVAEIVVEEYNRRRKTLGLRPWRAE